MKTAFLAGIFAVFTFEEFTNGCVGLVDVLAGVERAAHADLAKHRREDAGDDVDDVQATRDPGNLRRRELATAVRCHVGPSAGRRWVADRLWT